MRMSRVAVFALSATLAACGEKPPAPVAEKPVVEEPVTPPAPAPAPPKAELPPPKAPDTAAPKAETPKPAVRVTKDASGQDWTSHMGDIPFALDPVAAMDAAAKANRPLMLYFTSPG